MQSQWLTTLYKTKPGILHDLFYSTDDICGIREMQDVVLLHEHGRIDKIDSSIGFTWGDYDEHVINRTTKTVVDDGVFDAVAEAVEEIDQEEYMNFWNNPKHENLFVQFYKVEPSHDEILRRMFHKIKHYSKFYDYNHVGGVFEAYARKCVIHEAVNVPNKLLDGDIWCGFYDGSIPTNDGIANMEMRIIVLKEVFEYFNISVSDYVNSCFGSRCCWITGNNKLN